MITLVNRLRRALYRAGVLKAQRLPVPVISVGNITMGGAGKTPAVIAIARALSERGLRVGVLTRGYGRSGDGGPVESLDPDRFGDEPVLIKKHVPNANVIVGVNRYVNAMRYPCDVFVLDDGFQHLQIHRDLDIVIDAPSRLHRESRAAMQHADIVLTRDLRLSIPDTLRGKRVFAFAGLANNDQFFEALRREGLNVVGTRGFGDHHRYSNQEIAAIRSESADVFVTTEKDAVKISDPSIVAVPAEMIIPREAMERIITTASSGVAASQTADGGLRARPRKNVIVQALEYAAYRAVARLASRVSDDGVQRWGARLGRLARRVLRRRDRLAMRNLTNVFPAKSERERRAILNASWTHFGREALGYIRLQNMPLDQIAARCPFVNAEILDEALARGNGAVLISAHYGGWEVAGLAIMSRFKNVRTVARRLDNEILERDLARIRARTGAEVIDRRKAARPLMRGLSENAVIILLPDQAVLPREGMLVPFLGRSAWTTPAPAKMAVRAGSTIVFAFCIPDGARHRLEFEDPIRVDQLSEAERTDEALTTRINDVISRRITERPELWLWMHDRWKGTAPGESERTNGE